jgi:hypothetical protein
MRLFALLVAIVWSSAAVSAAERMYLIKLKFCEGKADAKAGDPNISVLSKPTICIQEGLGGGNIKIGGDFLLPTFGTKIVEQAHEGIFAEIDCQRIDAESVRLNMKVIQSKITQNEPENFVLSKSGSQVLLKAKLNTPVKTILHEKDQLVTWVEAEVEELPQQK